MKTRLLSFLLLFLLLCASLTVFAQTPPSAAGYWEGSITVPGTEMQIIVELVKATNGGWRGTISLPSQTNQPLPLLNLSVNGPTVTFGMAGAPGYPSFTGKLSADGKTIAGEVSQSGQSVPFQLLRKSETKLSAEVKPAVGSSGELKGDWEGTLEVGGQALRLKFKFAPSTDGSMAGVLDSIDQVVWLPIDTATESAGTVSVELKLVNATFKGKLTQDRKSIRRNMATERLSLPFDH